MSSILVLGVGNVLLSDEGIGVHVARHLQSTSLPPDVEVIDGGTEGFELIRFFDGRDEVVIIDCLISRDPPGTIIRADPEELSLEWDGCFSPHQSGLRELISLASSLPRPSALTILGIVPAVTGIISTELSPVVARSMGNITAAVMCIIRELRGRHPSDSNPQCHSLPGAAPLSLGHSTDRRMS